MLVPGGDVIYIGVASHHSSMQCRTSRLCSVCLCCFIRLYVHVWGFSSNFCEMLFPERIACADAAGA